MLSNKQQKLDITKLSKRTNELIKLSLCNEELKIDELEQYDRRQNLELEGIPEMPYQDGTQIIRTDLNHHTLN